MIVTTGHVTVAGDAAEVRCAAPADSWVLPVRALRAELVAVRGLLRAGLVAVRWLVQWAITRDVKDVVPADFHARVTAMYSWHHVARRTCKVPHARQDARAYTQRTRLASSRADRHAHAHGCRR